MRLLRKLLWCPAELSMWWHSMAVGLSLCFSLFLLACTREDKGPDVPSVPEITANTQANRYTGFFLYGANMGWLNNNWRDEDVADILVGNRAKGLEGAGVISLRPALYEQFVENWGFDVRVETFAYYESIEVKQNTVFIGDLPSDAHRERRQYVSGVPSESFENLYDPIWIHGADGIIVNENNYYAHYVYKLVQRYKNQVKFWEIKNEPDLTYRWDFAGALPGEPGSWWDNDPSPDQLINWCAPIQSYVRLLRVSYEVIKYVDPDAFVCVGGIGYPSFLDAVLRNSDNPDEGKITDAYPYQGGAWFDCLSFHIYPMYYLRSWAGSGFAHFRHSDAAAAALINDKGEYERVLANYGYGGQYPSKEVIVTETNIPHKQLGDYIGSFEAQRNYLVKAAITGQKNGLSAIYVYGPWDNAEQNGNGGEYDYMGLYKPLPNAPGGALRLNESGVAWRTMSRILRERRYDSGETAKLSLPSNMEGAAFYAAKTNDFVYAFWAKTSVDLSEIASATYVFPTSIRADKLHVTFWDGSGTEVNGRTLPLNGSPVFVTCN